MKRIILVLVLAVAVATTAGFTTSSPRSGTLHVTKECSQYNPAVADSFCTITSANIDAIRAGMNVVYASPADLNTGILNSDLVIDGPGRNTAFGHVLLDLHTLSGLVTLSGGTGRFTHFHAGPITVACQGLKDCSWEGPYWFSPQD
jgi:hypothetical protein